MARNQAEKQLFDLLVTRDFDPQTLDSQGKPAPTPEDAHLFSFDYKGESGKDYGTVVVMLNDDNSMSVFTGDNTGKSMEGDDKRGWFDFQAQLKRFAMKNLMSFNLQNLNKLKYSMQGQAALKEGLFESWQGKKDVSYNADATQARLMIKHKRNIGEGEARFRNIQALFIETADGERFKLPFNKLSGGRAMLEHVRQGGRPYDMRGAHISNMVNEMNLLARFKRANQSRIFEGEVANLVEQANNYYATLQHSLKSLGSKTGYTKYFESWNPANITDEDVIIEDLRHMFVEQNIDARVEQALPLLAKLQQEQAMKEINVFEGWMNLLSEGTWALPDSPEKQQQLVTLLSAELPVGPDATNATEQLYDILGDDELFDKLGELAEHDANADARTVILNRLEEMKSNPAVAQVIGKLKIESNPAEQQKQMNEFAPSHRHEHDHEECKYCGGNCPNDEDHACDGYSGDIDNLYANDQVDEGESCHVCHESTCACPHDQLEEGTGRTVADLSDEELDNCIDGSTDLNLVRRLAHLNELDSGGVEVEDFGFDFAESVSNNDSESYEANEEWGQSIANNINELLGAGRHIAELNKDTLGSYIKKASSDRASRNFDQGVDTGSTFQDREPKFDWHNSRKDDQRRSGIHKAVNRLVKEGYDSPLDAPDAVAAREHLRKAMAPVKAQHPDHPALKNFDEAASSSVVAKLAPYAEKIAMIADNGAGAIEQDPDLLDNSNDVDSTVEALRKVANLFRQDVGQGLASVAKLWAEPREMLVGEVKQRLKIDLAKLHDAAFPDANVQFGETTGGGNWLEEGSEPTVYEIYQTKGCKPYNAVLRTFSADTPEEAQADLEKFKQRRPEVDPSYFDVRELTDAGKHLDQLRQARERKPALEETTALTGQYGHSGKLEAVKGTDADMMDRIKFLAGITK